MIKVRRGAEGRWIISLPRGEGLVLRKLPQRLRSTLESPSLKESLARRLFPPAYREADREAEYRRLLSQDLLRRKLEGVSAFEETLASWTTRGARVEIAVAPAVLDLWLGVVNDLRLLLGVELEVDQEFWGRPFDPDHPQARDIALLHYLSWLQEELLAAMGEPPGA